MSERDRPDRLDVCRQLLPLLGDAIAVTSLGVSSWTLFTAGDRATNLYTQGSMGLVSSIGLGIAQARPDRQVISMEGEGSIMMNLSSLTTIGSARPANLTLLVWDDQLYTTTGGQPTHTADGVDLVAIARGAGLEATRCSSTDEAISAVGRALSTEGPSFVLVETRPLDVELLRGRMPPVLVKHRVMEDLGACRCHPREPRSR